jgi:hypothetical protein
LRDLIKNSLIVNSDKFVFSVATVDFLGHTVLVRGIKPIKCHAAALLQHPCPATVKQLQAFLRLLNFYCQLIPAAPKILRPLTEFLKGGKSGTTAVD